MLDGVLCCWLARKGDKLPGEGETDGVNIEGSIMWARVLRRCRMISMKCEMSADVF